MKPFSAPSLSIPPTTPPPETEAGAGTGVCTDTAADPPWKSKLLDMYFQQAPLAVISGMVVAAIMGFVLNGSVPSSLLMPWLITTEALMSVRVLVTFFYLKGPVQVRQSIGLWIRVAHVQTALSGLAWGCLGLFYPMIDQEMHRLAIVVTLMGLCAGSAALIGSVHGTLPTFGLLALGPLMGIMIAHGDSASVYMGGALLYYVYLVMIKGPSRISLAMEELHARKRDHEALVARLEDAERVGQMGHVVWDHPAHRATLSAEVCRQFGLENMRESRDGWALWNRVIPADRDRVVALSRQAARSGTQELRFDTRISGPFGLRDLRVVQRFAYDAQGVLLRTLTTTQDVTELKETQRELHELAYIDTLTGLSNRACFHRRLHDHQIKSVLMLDLDHFKNVNDTLGHAVGDRLLVEVARRLGTCLREQDMVARLGGDEFAVLINDLLPPEQLERIAQRIVDTLSAPYDIDGHDIVVSASIGIASAAESGTDPDTLMRHADTALFEAKARGRSRHQFHSEELTRRTRERVALEADLRRALAEHQFSVHYQPKIDLSDGRIVGAEALLRWQHPERGNIPPDVFIPIAEDCGLIVPLGAWVLRESCHAAVDWNRDRRPDHRLRIAVNLSPRQFLNNDLIRTVAESLADTGCEPEWIELEITERLLLDERSHAEDTLHGLRALGLTLAIDDFGTGYSALGYLTRYPIGTLKIDKSFMRDITTQADRAGVVRAIISMGHSLKLGLVAEGVETEEQARFLLEQGCELAQGWLYGRPMPPERFTTFLAERERELKRRVAALT